MNIRLNTSTAIGFKAKRQKFGLGSLLFLILFGIAFTWAGLAALGAQNIDPTWPKVNGKVVSSLSSDDDSSTKYTAVVEYHVNGQAYQVTSGIKTSYASPVGEIRQVAYNTSRPSEAKIAEPVSTSWWLYLFPLIGIACMIIAPIAFINSLKRTAAINRLVQTGQKLQGIITDIETSNTKQNNKSSYKIVVSATDTTGVVRQYVSDAITGIGGLALANLQNNPIPIDVYVDPTNPENYYVDISDIPNLTPERIAELIKASTHNQPNTFTQGEAPNPPVPSPIPSAPSGHAPQAFQTPPPKKQ